MPMQDKVVLVTGGSAGLGRATAELLASEGAKVVIAARNATRGEQAARDIAQAGGQVEFIRADVSVAADVKELISRIVQTHGRLDCALNNAAVLNKTRPLADFSEQDFDQEVSSNLKSVWLCMKFEIEQMRKQSPRGGTIVNTSSINGLGGARNASLYSMAKAGILALTKAAAQEYAAYGIRLNSLVAGGFDTEMLRKALSGMAGGDVTRIKQAFESFAALVPAGRIGKPSEAAQAALWLLNDASSYVTGHSMIVDGGLTAWAR